jgi:hypothetical protein
VRAVVVAATLTIACGMLASLTMTQAWQFAAYYGVVVGLGTGMVAQGSRAQSSRPLPALYVAGIACVAAAALALTIARPQPKAVAMA